MTPRSTWLGLGLVLLSDYRHRNGFTNDFPTEFGPFGLVTFERKPKKALAALHALWTGAVPGR